MLRCLLRKIYIKKGDFFFQTLESSNGLNKFDLKRKGKISFRKFSFPRFPRKLNFRIKRFSALDIFVYLRSISKEKGKRKKKRGFYIYEIITFLRIIFNNFNITQQDLNLMHRSINLPIHAFSRNIHTCDYLHLESPNHKKIITDIYIYIYTLRDCINIFPDNK